MKNEGVKIDWGHFENNIFQVFGKIVSLEMVARYIDSVLQSLAKIEQNPEKPHQHLQALVSSSQSIGAVDVVTYVGRVQAKIDSQQSAVSSEHLQKIKEITTLTARALKDYCLQEAQNHAVR